MPEDQTQTPPTESKRLELSENRSLDQIVMMAAVVTPEPVAPAPSASASAGDGAQATGTPPADFDG
jgi:hypothetical protein